MQRRLETLLVITPICLSACGVLDPVVCTLEARFGVSVQVVDAASGTALAEGSTMTLRDGDYVETTSESFDGRTLVGAGERAGTYIITVAREGYHSWVLTDVEVTEDECHVDPVSLLAELEAI